ATTCLDRFPVLRIGCYRACLRCDRSSLLLRPRWSRPATQSTCRTETENLQIQFSEGVAVMKSLSSLARLVRAGLFVGFVVSSVISVVQTVRANAITNRIE